MQHVIVRAIRRNFVRVLLVGVFVVSGTIALTDKPATAVAGINQQMNFQGRLLNAQGAVVPDGNYNIQFKIYQDGDGQTANNTTGSPAGSLKWTESWLNSGGKGVLVKNGYMSVQLGSITPFGSSIDWNQDTLWLSINIGNTNTSCTPFTSCGGDGEMLPMKRLSATPYALNAGMIGGRTADQFVQLAQGVQADASTNTSSIFLNKTGAGGNLMQLQGDGTDVFTLNRTGDIVFGSASNHSITIASDPTGYSGMALTVAGGNSGTSNTLPLRGGNLVLQGGASNGHNGGGGMVYIDGGTKSGTGSDGGVMIGTVRSGTVTIGNTALGSGNSQHIFIGWNSGGGNTDVTIGSTAGATSGKTTLQAKDSVTIGTNDVARGTFDNAGNLYLGNGVTATAPSSFTVSGTQSVTTGVTGGALVVQGGNATVGNANGGNLTLSGGAGTGTGSNGLVVMTTPTFSTTTNDPNCYAGGAPVAASCSIAQTSINNSAAILVGFNTDGRTATMPDPTITTAGRVIYVTASGTSSDFTLSVNGGGQGNQIAMRKNTTATMIWNGSDWTAAGASSSTTLQAAYDNTLQSAGGAELVVSKTGTTNGLTIRDSSVNPVDGTLFSVQTSSAAELIQINSNVTEYASDAGAEVAGASPTTFPASTWGPVGAASISRYTTAGDYIATGQGSVRVASSSANDGTKNTLARPLTANMHYNVSFTTRLTKGSASTFTNMLVSYSKDGLTTGMTECTTGQTSATSVWTKVNCTFTAPASGITTGNAIVIQQATAANRVFYVDNLSVTIAADYNLASDGSVDDVTNFATNWSPVNGSTVTRTTTAGNDASSSAQVVGNGTTAGQGVRNKLSINPLANTMYRVTAYVAGSTSFNDFTVRYSRDGGTNFTSCADYNTQAITTDLSKFTMVTCYINTDATTPTNPYVYFTQTAASNRTFYVDTFSLTLSTVTTPNVQIGGGVNGGPTTLFTLDRSASAPIAANNDALLGSMYYDTSLGKLQCYEADGWGACGSSPDNIITISPEYTNAVLHGTGIGTMTSDICSSTLGLNDGSNGQPTICGDGETYNFYKWTSPQATTQSYSIYVTYQLPGTFKGFNSGQTSLMGRTDNGSNGGAANLSYQVYRNSASSGLVPCGGNNLVSTGTVSGWQTKTANGAADPSTCGFAPGDSIVFKITVAASRNANAYVGNLNFAFSNR